MSYLSISYGVLRMSKFAVKIRPWVWGIRPSRPMHFPLETVASSSHCILVTRKLAEIWQFMYFLGSLLNLKAERSKTIFQLPRLKAIQEAVSECQTFRFCVENCPDILPITISWSLHFGLIYFLGQGHDHEHQLDIFVLFPSRATSSPKTASKHLEFLSLPARTHHIRTHARSPYTEGYSSWCRSPGCQWPVLTH